MLSQLIDVMKSGFIHMMLNDRPNGIIHWICLASLVATMSDAMTSGVVHRSISIVSRAPQIDRKSKPVKEQWHEKIYLQSVWGKPAILNTENIKISGILSCWKIDVMFMSRSFFAEGIHSCFQICKVIKSTKVFESYDKRCTATILWFTVITPFWQQ